MYAKTILPPHAAPNRFCAVSEKIHIIITLSAAKKQDRKIEEWNISGISLLRSGHRRVSDTSRGLYADPEILGCLVKIRSARSSAALHWGSGSLHHSFGDGPAANTLFDIHPILYLSQAAAYRGCHLCHAHDPGGKKLAPRSIDFCDPRHCDLPGISSS